MEYFVTELSDSGPGSLRDAIQEANYYNDDEEIIITIAEELEGVICLESDLSVYRKMTINNNSRGSVSLDGWCDYGKWYVTGDGILSAGKYVLNAIEDITLNNLTLPGVKVQGNAKISGEGIVFTSACPVFFNDWSGNTDEVITDWSKVQLPHDACLNVHSMNSVYGDLVIRSVPGGIPYGIGSSVPFGVEVSVEEGVSLKCLETRVEGKLLLNGVCLDGMLCICPGGAVEGEGNSIASSCTIRLEGWTGPTADGLAWVDGFTVEGGTLHVAFDGFAYGDITLSALPGVVVSYDLAYMQLWDGQTLAAESGVEVTGAVVVGQGGKLQLDKAIISAEIELSSGAVVEGSGNTFSSKAFVRLHDWSGSTDILSTLVEGGGVHGGILRVCVSYMGGGLELCALGGAGVYYELEQVYGAIGDEIRVGNGVIIGGEIELATESALILDGAFVDATVKLNGGAVLEGDGCVFKSGASIILTGWQGETSSAFAYLVDPVFESGRLDVEIENAMSDVVLSALPGVQTIYHINSEFFVGNITVEPGVTLCGNFPVISGSSLVLNGARVDAQIKLDAGAILSGKGNTFTESSAWVFDYWTGSTADVLSGLEDSVYEGGACVSGCFPLEGMMPSYPR